MRMVSKESSEKNVAFLTTCLTSSCPMRVETKEKVEAGTPRRGALEPVTVEQWWAPDIASLVLIVVRSSANIISQVKTICVKPASVRH